MKFDVVLAGVGGQGILSVAEIIALTAVCEGLKIKQSEVHGMSQRGGAVAAHLRISDGRIAADTISRGDAQMILSAEPLETLRQLPYLAPDGTIVSSTNVVDGIEGYPDEQAMLGELQRFPNAVLIDAFGAARASGTSRAANTVLLGAAASFLPLRAELLVDALRRKFASKGDRVVNANVKAFMAGADRHVS